MLTKPCVKHRRDQGDKLQNRNLNIFQINNIVWCVVSTICGQWSQCGGYEQRKSVVEEQEDEQLDGGDGLDVETELVIGPPTEKRVP